MRKLGLTVFWAIGGALAPRPLLATPLEPRIESEVAYQAPVFGTARYTSVGAGVGVVVQPGVEAGAGARVLLGALDQSPGFAAFSGLKLFAAHGVWRPGLGMELELASSLRASATADEISGSLTRRYAASDSTLIRVGMVLAPLRLQLERVLLSVASVRLATPLDASAGERLYVGLTLVNVGWAL
ncbi:MAG TPA: hypothetical protein VNN80_20225 [Polyangiaceae bacterium]|nr:hypothetical protein [Polyangiaceae bacterium]